MLSEKPNAFTLKRFVLYAGLAIVGAGLLLFMYLSYFNRYWADDWCYNADLLNKGFLQTLGGYFNDVTYTPSRYSVTIFAGLLQVFGVAGVQWMTPLTILVWVAGLVFLLWNVARLAGFQPALPLMAFFSVLIVYFSVYLTPQLYQSLYWRTGMLTYTTPLALMTWVLVLITRQGLLGKSSNWEIALAGLLSLIAGGCSEAGATVQVSALGLYVLLALLGAYRQQPWAKKTLGIAVAALFFAIVAMCLLIFAPTTQIRKARYGTPTSLLELPHLIFSYTYAFFVLAIKDYYHVLIALLSALVGFVYPITRERPWQFRQYILLGLIAAVVAILLVAASLTPSLYIEKGLPAPRTMIIPGFIAVLGFVFGGWAAGSAVQVVFKPSALQTSATLLLLVALAFPAFTLIKAGNWITVYSQRASLWDARDAVIQVALQDGSKRAIVTGIDGADVGGIRDFDPKEKKGYWITQCAAAYYGIRLDVVLP